ncbi:MAG TPA: hypothetical protein VGP65_01485, partial [Candidatus Angelobacter sp.]|nr:hypothetical protein [Candidatus Angelobacter sp.]
KGTSEDFCSTMQLTLARCMLERCVIINQFYVSQAVINSAQRIRAASVILLQGNPHGDGANGASVWNATRLDPHAHLHTVLSVQR